MALVMMMPLVPSECVSGAQVDHTARGGDAQAAPAQVTTKGVGAIGGGSNGIPGRQIAGAGDHQVGPTGPSIQGIVVVGFENLRRLCGREERGKKVDRKPGYRGGLCHNEALVGNVRSINVQSGR